MKKDKYVYPAIFDYADDGISINFPDLSGVFSCAFDETEALEMAKEALGLHLFELEKLNENIPEATLAKDVKIEENQSVQLIDVYMPIVREYLNNQSVKKTLTIPRWIDTQIQESGQKINLSGILQESLIKILGIEKPSNHTK